MAFYIVTHKVEDFTAWKNIYDGFASCVVLVRYG